MSQDSARRSVGPRGSRGASVFSLAAAAARGDSPGGGRPSVSRQAGQVRYSQSSSRRGSRAPSVARGSVRYGRGAAVDSAGLAFERILCIDEEGRDRTPKPLVAARTHVGGGDGPLPGWGADGQLGGGNGTQLGSGADGASSDRGSILSFAPLLGSSGMPTARSFLASEAGEPSREPSFDGDALPMGRSARNTSAGPGELGQLALAASAAVGGVALPVRERLVGGGRKSQLLAAALLDAGRAESLPVPSLHTTHLQQQLHQQLDMDRAKSVPVPQQQPSQQQSQQQKQLRQQQRCKGTQCQAASRSSRGVQVLPWELKKVAASQPDEAAEAAPLGAPQRAGQAGERGEEEGDGAAEDEEALLAMQGGGGGGEGGGYFIGVEESMRGSPTPSHRGGMTSQSASRRGSMMGGGSRRGSVMGGASRRGSIMGGGRESTMHGDDFSDYMGSRPGTAMGSRRTSMQAGGEHSNRNSFSSTKSGFASAFGRAEGRGSVLGGGAGFHAGGGRSSVLSQRGGAGGMGSAGSGHAPAPQLTAAELAAREARRLKAEQEQALARLPGLLIKLQAAEKAVLVNVQHAKLALYHSVLYCPESAGQQQSGQQGQLPSACGSAGGAFASAQASLRPSVAGSASSRDASDTAAGLAELAAAAVAAVGSQKSFAATPAALASSLSASPLTTSRQPRSELQLLWTWQSELSRELPVSCLAFNRAAPGLLAVGYGRLEYALGSTGLLAVWSLANPTHPLWHANTPCGVSALDWSGKSASCLAVGFFDGSLALYDVRSGGNSQQKSSGSSGSAGAPSGHPKPLARAPPAGASGGSGGGHSEPVWRMRHVPKASDPGEEMLVSISSDGWLLEWKHAQGLERSELLRLKRQQGAGARRLQGSSSGGEERPAGAEGYLGRAGGGTCFDFCPADPRTYLVGTEDGGVHRCSTAFTEQYVQSYSGHLAPVYQVCWSPFSPGLFLTASADWSIRLWSESSPRSLWTFQLPASKFEVSDLAWCPAAATLFAAVAGNTLQVWDVERSVLAPWAMATRFGVRLTALAFSQAAPVVVVGADDGSVAVYSLAGMQDSHRAPVDEQEQRQRLEAVLKHHTAQAMAE